MRIAVTGATGFIGSRLVEHLARRGHEVVCLARATSDRSRVNTTDIEWVDGDLLKGLRTGCFGRADAVINLASIGDFGAVSEQARREMMANNELALTNLFSAFDDTPPGRIIHYSSMAAVGFQPGVTVSNETDPRPETLYGQAKLRGEEVAKAIAASSEAKLVILRPSLVYGPGDRGSDFLTSVKLIQRGVFPIFGRGDNIMSPVIFVDDLVQLTEAFLESEVMGTYLCARDEKFSVREFVATVSQALGRRFGGVRIPSKIAQVACVPVELLCRKLGRPAPLTSERVSHLATDRRFDRIEADLMAAVGQSPGTDLAGGVATTLAWYRQTGLL